MSAAPTVYFHEDQRFRAPMLTSVAGFLLLAVFFIVLATFYPSVRVAGALFATAVLVVAFALVGFAHLETEIRDDAVSVRFRGLWLTRLWSQRVALDELDRFEARRYTFWESIGWGVHTTSSGMAYNVSGHEGVILELKNGRKILVGTQRPKEFAVAIAQALEARRAATGGFAS